MTCEFMVVTDKGKPEKAGSITFTPPGGLAVKSVPGYEKLMDNIASGRATTGRGRENWAKKDPAGWFKNLPRVFRGTYLFCRMVEDHAEAAHTRLQKTIAMTTKYCVYTIVDPKKLVGLTAKPFEDTQQKLWVTAEILWQEGKDEKARMPILIGDATDVSRLLYWGFLDDVNADKNVGKTTFVVDQLRVVKGKHSPQELRLRSSGEKIAPNFIRPYAICFTPPFIGHG